MKLTEPKELLTVYEGALAEQFVGQELLNSGPHFEEGVLHYWGREAKNANAEVDYLLAHGTRIIPVEVKAGKTGALKSLHLFLYDKKLQFGLRFNMDKPSIGHLSAKVRLKKREGDLTYSLLSLPLYLVGQLHRLLNSDTLKTSMRCLGP